MFDLEQNEKNFENLSAAYKSLLDKMNKTLADKAKYEFELNTRIEELLTKNKNIETELETTKGEFNNKCLYKKNKTEQKVVRRIE